MFLLPDRQRQTKLSVPALEASPWPYSRDGCYSNTQGILSSIHTTVNPKALTWVFEVPNVLCSKSGRTSSGTLHLTAHHLIFSYTDVSQSEMWASPVPHIPPTHSSLTILYIGCVPTDQSRHPTASNSERAMSHILPVSHIRNVFAILRARYGCRRRL